GLAGLDAAEAEARLSDLAGREIVTQRRDAKFAGHIELAFRHALVRDACYATLTEADRALGHRLAGAWLERSGRPEALVVAEPLPLGGDRPRAAAAYVRASMQALGANVLGGAIERAERAAALGAEGETLGALRLLQAEAYQWRGRTADAERCA